MGSTWTVLMALMGLIAGGASLSASDGAADKQLAVARENAQKFGRNKPLALFEQNNLFVVGDLPEGHVQRLAQSLQKQYAVAAKALGFTDAEKPWPGKLAIYLLSDRAAYASFVRTVEHRRPESDESYTMDVRRPEPHVAIGPPERGGPSADEQAGRQLAIALLKKCARPNAGLPEWLRDGFGRATAYRARFSLQQLPARTGNREWSAKISRRASVAVTWSAGLSPELRSAFGAQLSDLLAYGPFMAKFPAFVKAFGPIADAMPNATTVKKALAAAKIDPLALERAWARWR